MYQLCRGCVPLVSQLRSITLLGGCSRRVALALLWQVFQSCFSCVPLLGSVCHLCSRFVPLVFLLGLLESTHEFPAIHSVGLFFFAARKFSGAGLFYWAASRHRLCLYWPVSKCAVGREGVSPDLPLLGWESTGRHSWRGVGRGVEDLRQGCGGWKDLQTEDWQRRKRLLHG